jgi:GTPase
VRIEQTIFVARESQRKIVLGRGADHQGDRPIRPQGDREFAECPVHLFLFVKVRENWATIPERYREMGLEFPREG